MRIIKISIAKVLVLFAAMLMLNGNTLLAQINVTLPTLSKAAGSPSDYIPITVGSLTGKNVTAFEFTVYYDKDIVSITGASTDGTIASGAPMFNADTANGKIKVAWASASAISDSGVLVKLNVKYKKVGSTNLTFVDPATSKSTFLFNAGTPAAAAKDGKIIIPSVSVNFGAISGWVGDTLCVPVVTTDITATDNILSFDFAGTFDQNIIKVIGYQTQNTLSNGGTATINTTEAGKVKFAWANAAKISGKGNLVLLKVVALKKGSANLTLTSFQYNAGTPVASPVMGGDVSVTDANRKPVFTVSLPKDVVIFVDDSLGTKTQTYKFQFKASDPDLNQKLIFSAVKIPFGATLDTLGNFSWKPATWQRNQTHTIIISVTDGFDVVKDTSKITASKMTDVEPGNTVVTDYSLHQNYPNPFNPSTKIVYALPQASKVRLSVFNLLGQEIAVLVNEFQNAGKHSVQFNASNLTSGMYLYRIEATNFISVKKMTLVK
ncbi:MAG: cohesin domain-containing protein [Ignavibacteriales bacterium]